MSKEKRMLGNYEITQSWTIVNNLDTKRRKELRRK